jgi:tetratricopeptide (TPR) repeat protein
MISAGKYIISILFTLLITSSFCQPNTDWLGQKEPIDRFYILANCVRLVQNDAKKLDSFTIVLKEKGPQSDVIHAAFLLKYDSLVKKSGLTLGHHFDIYDEFLEKAKKTKDQFFIAYLLQSKAQTYRACAEFTKALEYYLYAYEEVVKDPNKQYFKSSYFFHEMGVQFFEFKDYEKALKFGLICHQTNYHNDPNPKENWLAKANTNLIGEAYRKLNKPDSAFYWYQQCINYSQGRYINDTLWQGIATDCFAGVFFDQKKYDSSLIYYLKSVSILKGYGQYLIDHNINSYSTIAEIYLQKNNPQQAAAFLKLAEPYIPIKEFNSSLLHYYKALFQLNRYQKASEVVILKNLDSVNKYQQIVDKELDEKQKIIAEANIAYNKKVYDNNLIQEKYIVTRIKFYAVIVIALLMVILTILYLKRRNLHHQLQQQQALREKEKAKEALTLAQTQLEDFAKNIHDKNQLIEQFTLEVENLKLQSSERANEKEEIIDKLKQSVILTEADWQNYKIMFDKAYPQFADNIKTQFPSITTGELRYLMFNKLNLDNKEMAALLGISLEAIRNLKFRVKNKIGTNTEFFEA